MSKLTTLAFLDFNQQQQQDFYSILILSTQGLDEEWEIVDKTLATVIFVHYDETITQSQWEEIEAAYPMAKLVAYSENLAHIETQWTLLTKTNKPPLRSELIRLLNQIGAENLNVNVKVNEKLSVKVSEKPSIVEETAKISSKSPFFLSEHYFLSIVQNSLQSGNTYRCKFQDNISLYLLPKQNCYFCSAEIVDLYALFLTHPDKIEITMMSEKELKQQVKGLKTKALNDLLWHSTVTVSKGRFMKSHDPEQNVRLKYWPDISQVSSNKSYLPIASFMSNNIANVIKISQHTGQKLSDVLDFHNACNVLGLVDTMTDLSIDLKVNTNRAQYYNQPIPSTLCLEVAA
ncbi:MAG: hypothetical protein Q9M50_01650 [Methylococcales bacterium]|nr:hypothetical protein [Methylococcales bacterium]